MKFQLKEYLTCFELLILICLITAGTEEPHPYSCLSFKQGGIFKALEIEQITVANLFILYL